MTWKMNDNLKKSLSCNVKKIKVVIIRKETLKIYILNVFNC